MCWDLLASCPRKTIKLHIASSLKGSLKVRQCRENFVVETKSHFIVNGNAVHEFRKLPPGVTIAENVVGRDKTILRWFVRYILNVGWQCVRVYGPLHLLWAAFRLPNRTPISVIAANTARSTAFLTSYVCSLQVMLMLNSYIVKGSPTRMQLHSWAWLSGLAVLLERSNRQSELAFFCASHACNSLFNHAKRLGWIAPSQFVGVVLGMIATGQIMKFNAERPGRTMHLLFGEKRGRLSQIVSQKFESNEEKEGNKKNE
jgi:hypothetical protein